MSKVNLPFRLPAPREGRVDLLVVAAEHSGDEHAARAVRALCGRRPGVVVAALGGPQLAQAGAQLLHDLTAGSVLGLGEVLKRYSFFRALIAEVVRWVGEYRPHAVCFVDSSGLNLRIARGLFEQGFSAKAGGPTRAVYYISPQLWASRARRRFAMAKHLDSLAAIFPFEPKVYADTPLPVEFVGHPFVAPDYAPPVRYDPAGPVLLLPGSRPSAVARIFPVLLEAFRAATPGREAVVLYPGETVLTALRAAGPPEEVKLVAVGGGAEPQAASAVLTSSGTMSLHCALAGIPGAITYRTDGLTYWLGRLLVKVEYLGIANLLLGEPMYPEFIQGAARPADLARELRACLENGARREDTRRQSERLHALLRQPAGATVGDWLERQLT
ncbi:MAG: lipid-A-disaccharide synthase [Opitutales bacterium]